MTGDEVDLESGFLIMPAAAPLPPPPPTTGGATGGSSTSETPVESTPPVATGGQTTGTMAGGAPRPAVRTSVRIAFPASREEVFKSFAAIANLADKSDGGKIRVTVHGQAAAGYEANWLRNAVEEPLNEADIEGLEIE